MHVYAIHAVELLPSLAVYGYQGRDLLFFFLVGKQSKCSLSWSSLERAVETDPALADQEGHASRFNEFRMRAENRIVL